MSFLGYPKVNPHTKFEHFRIIRFWVMLWTMDISVKNTLIDPVSLTFQPKNHIISRIYQGHSPYQVWTLWDFLFLSYAPDKQTDGFEHPTHTDISVSRGNNWYF